MTLETPKVVPATAFGRRFRSTTEARWAVCLTELGLQWEYEAETFDLGPLGWYLPDFWLPSFQASDDSLGAFLEVKPDLALADRDYDKAARLRALTGRPVMVALGFGIPPLRALYDRIMSSDNPRRTGFRGEIYDVRTNGADLPTAGAGGREHYFLPMRTGTVVLDYSGFNRKDCDPARLRRAYEAGASFRPDRR